jgi:hypothetical protein
MVFILATAHSGVFAFLSCKLIEGPALMLKSRAHGTPTQLDLRSIAQVESPGRTASRSGNPYFAALRRLESQIVSHPREDAAQILCQS